MLSKPLPYVYICTHKETKEYYIGYRYKNTIPSYQDLPIYRTSSKKVKDRFDEFEYAIIAEFFNKEDAYLFEQTLIKDHFDDPQCLNQTHFHGHKMFTKHSRETKEKIRKALTGRKRPPFTEEAKVNMAIARKNRNFQLVHSEVTKQKMRDAHIGRIYPEASEEKKLAISAANKGKKRTHEQCLRIAQACQNRGPRGPRSEETKRKIAETLRKNHRRLSV